MLYQYHTTLDLEFLINVVFSLLAARVQWNNKKVLTTEKKKGKDDLTHTAVPFFLLLPFTGIDDVLLR